MKKLLLIFITLPSILLSQNIGELSQSELRNINQSIINCLTDYENESKVTRRNVDEFYEIFVEDEFIINDLVPSESYGDFINCTDWIDLMKGIRVYNVETNIIDFKEYNIINKDSGTVKVIVNKIVKSAIWSDKVKPEFNILLTVNNETISQKVNYFSSDNYEFIFSYKLDGNEYSYAKIIRIAANDTLNRMNVYIPYSKSLFRAKKIMKSVAFSDTSNFVYGDNIKYFTANADAELANYKIEGFRNPTIINNDKSFIKDLVYFEKTPLSLSYAIGLYDKSNVFEFGDKIIPTNIEYSESLNLSLSWSPILVAKKYNILEDIYLFAAVDVIKSTIDIGIDSYENISELSNPISNHENTYTRKNTITNFSETLTINQQNLFVGLSANFSNIGLSARTNAYSSTQISSSRKASSKYTGIFHNEFEIEIDEPITYNIDGIENTLELGYKEWDVNEELDLVQERFSLWEFELKYEISSTLKSMFKNNNIDIHLFIRYKNNNSWYKNTSEQISEDVNEFNSFVNFSEKFEMNGIFLGGFNIGLKL